MLKKFTIITHNEAQQVDEKTNILINTEHIVSIKPIKLTTKNRDVIDGYWIRLTNGKKYRAVQIPESIRESLNENLPAISLSNETESSFNYQ